jgi:hypothetical protein
MRILILSIPILLLLPACVTHEMVARTRASNDLQCAEESVNVSNIGGTSYRAVGCEKEATYNCITGQNTITCVREEQKDHPSEGAGTADSAEVVTPETQGDESAAAGRI